MRFLNIGANKWTVKILRNHWVFKMKKKSKNVYDESILFALLVITFIYLVAPKRAVLFIEESSHFTSLPFSWRQASWRASLPRVSWPQVSWWVF